MHIKKGQSSTASSMKVTNKVIHVPKSPVRTYHINDINDDEEEPNEPVVCTTLNVPSSPKYNIVEDETKDKKQKEADDAIADLLTHGIQNISLSTKSDSQDEYEEDEEEDVTISPDLVPRCPTRTKDKLKEDNKANSKPYPDRRSSQPYRTQSGGTVSEGSYVHEFDNFQNIPVSVVELSEEPINDQIPLSEVNFFEILTKDQQNTFGDAIEHIEPSISNILQTNLPDDNLIFQSPSYSISPSDSNYFSGQPSPSSSVCSPSSRYNFLSSEGEMSPGCDSYRFQNNQEIKPQTNSIKYNITPTYDRNIPNVSPLNPVYNISSPKIDDPLSPHLYSPSHKYCNSLSIDSESTSHDSSSVQYNQENIDKTSSWNFPYLEESTCNIPLSSPKNYLKTNDLFSSSYSSIPILSQENCNFTAWNFQNNEDNSSNITLQSSRPIIKSNNDVLFNQLSSSAPIQSFAVNVPNLQIQPSLCHNVRPSTGRPTKSNILPPPTGRPTTCIKIPSRPHNTNTYTQLTPVKNVARRNIEQAGVLVPEVNLDIPGAQRLSKKCKEAEKELAWIKICLESEEIMNSVNSKNETKLVQILKEDPNKKQFLETIFARVRRMQKEKRKELFLKRDIKGHDALYTAVMWQKNHPELGRFIADTYVELGLNPDEVYGENNDGLLHILARSGDEYAEVLADLLRVHHPNSLRRAFDVNKRNKNSLTPLHIAATTHMTNGLSTLTITNLLIKHGAHLKTQNSEGKTALHLAVQNHCDPIYVKALLQSPRASAYINLTDNDGNTPLHICAANNNISFEKQKAVLNQLKTSGAIHHNTYNNDRKLPLHFVSPEKKEEVKNILNKKH